MTMRAEKVFKPGAYPTYTYVSRHYEDTDISYELRLKQALRTAGCLTSIIGPSKMGKTILCEKVIGLDNIVEISGADFNENTDFWATVAAKVELPYMGEITTERFSKTEEITDRDGKNEKYVLSKDKIIEYYIQHNKVLVMYGLIVESLAKNPPLTEISFETFYSRIIQLIKLSANEKNPEKSIVKEHLRKLQNVLEAKEEIYRAIEWKDGKVYVLDPLFLFYLRWGRKNG